MGKEAERRIDYEPDQETAPSVPWRVEGAPEPPDHGPSRRRGLARFAVLVLSSLILLGVNWLAASSALGPPSRASISYTFFRQQAGADAIEGQFRRPVAVPGAPASQKVTLFATQRPSFANDNLFQLFGGRTGGGLTPSCPVARRCGSGCWWGCCRPCFWWARCCGEPAGSAQLPVWVVRAALAVPVPGVMIRRQRRG